MIKGIIFDMDGTITLTEPLHHEAFAAIFKKYGIDFTYEEEVKRFAGAGSPTIFTTVFKERGKEVSPQEIERCIELKKELYTKIVHKSEIPVVRGVEKFVRNIHERGIKKIIATGNSNLDAVRFMLKKIGLLNYFPDIVSVSEVARGKPFPDVFLEAARRLGIAPAECIVLEDAINGILAAKSAGIPSVALETTTSRDELKNSGAAVVIRDYTELTDSVLGSLNNLAHA